LAGRIQDAPCLFIGNPHLVRRRCCRAGYYANLACRHACARVDIKRLATLAIRHMRQLADVIVQGPVTFYDDQSSIPPAFITAAHNKTVQKICRIMSWLVINHYLDMSLIL
jgi:hypothetical protein